MFYIILLKILGHPIYSLSCFAVCCWWQITWLKIERPSPPSLVFFLLRFLRPDYSGKQSLTFFPDLLRHATTVKHRWQNWPNLILRLETAAAGGKQPYYDYLYFFYLVHTFRGQQKIDSNLQYLFLSLATKLLSCFLAKFRGKKSKQNSL